VVAQFFMLGWARCGFDKMYVGTHYGELVFFNTVESVGHVLFMIGMPGAVSIKSASGHVTLNFYFCICWDPWVM
jgi:hypothetical protein